MMRVLFLDDDEFVLTDGLADLDTQRFSVNLCLSIEAAKAALTDEAGNITADDLVLFVDHDLGGGRKGYEFVEWVRQRHQRGHLLPIIYLTGRESERGYIQQQAQSPYHAPSAYLGKREFAQTSFDINEFIAGFVSEFNRGSAEVDRQRLEQTMRFFESLPDSEATSDDD